MPGTALDEGRHRGFRAAGTAWNPSRSGAPGARMAWQGGLCVAGWLASVLVGHIVDYGPGLHPIALAVHILALVLSFGAVLVVDWLGIPQACRWASILIGPLNSTARRWAGA